MFQSPAAAQVRSKVLVGEHIHSDDNKDVSRALMDIIRRKISRMPSEITDAADNLKAHISSHTVVADSSINDNLGALENEWNTKSFGLILIAGGYEADGKLFSSIYFIGTKTEDFRPDHAFINLQNRLSHTSSVDLANLLLHYAMIKEARRQSLDEKSIINPLVERSKEIADTLQQQNPDKIVDEIREDLEKLTN